MKIWTDGCCLKNPGGAGGWAFVVVQRDEILHTASGGDPSTTNNIMELTAVIEAMRWYSLPGGAMQPLVEILTDSKYVQRGITEWMPAWKKRDWQRKTRDGLKPVKNVRHWQVIDAIRTPQMSFTWVKGHAELRFNELADELAGQAARLGLKRE